MTGKADSSARVTSAFDFAGRVYKGVPVTTSVPPHRFVGETGLVIGEDPKESHRCNSY